MIALPGSWQDRAACLGHSPDLFFPERADATVQIRKAKKICATCPVTAECLAMALANDEKFGVFGGLTPGERGAVRIRRRSLRVVEP